MPVLENGCDYLLIPGFLLTPSPWPESTSWAGFVSRSPLCFQESTQRLALAKYLCFCVCVAVLSGTAWSCCPCWLSRGRINRLTHPLPVPRDSTHVGSPRAGLQYVQHPHPSSTLPVTHLGLSICWVPCHPPLP